MKKFISGIVLAVIIVIAYFIHFIKELNFGF